MAKQYAYRSIEPKFGFRVDKKNKLSFVHDDDTAFDNRDWAIMCEDYVASGHLDRIGKNPIEEMQEKEEPTTVHGPGGTKSTKGPAPNTDAREKDDSNPEPKKDASPSK